MAAKPIIDLIVVIESGTFALVKARLETLDTFIKETSA